MMGQRPLQRMIRSENRVSQSMNPYNGLLIVDKPGRAFSLDGPRAAQQDDAREERDFPTSHDVVSRVRRWSKQRRIGHTGTLDPMASGVLVLCLGSATRLVEYYQGHAKQYYAEIQLGSATDTYDAFGQITRRAPIPPLSAAQIEAALERFRGDILQRPPLFSALKKGGESLHRKARRGEQVDVEPRPVTFHQLDLLQYEPDGRIALRVLCSAGGYIRSLAHDLGEALGSVAHLSVLRREAAGPFTLEDAYTLPQIEEAARVGQLAQLLLPLGERLEIPRIALDAETVTRLGHGQRVVLDAATQRAVHSVVAQAEADADPQRALAQGIDPHGTFAGIMRYIGPAHSSESGTIWKAEKWFAT